MAVNYAELVLLSRVSIPHGILWATDMSCLSMANCSCSSSRTCLPKACQGEMGARVDFACCALWLVSLYALLTPDTTSLRGFVVHALRPFAGQMEADGGTKPYVHYGAFAQPLVVPGTSFPPFPP